MKQQANYDSELNQKKALGKCLQQKNFAFNFIMKVYEDKLYSPTRQHKDILLYTLAIDEKEKLNITINEINFMRTKLLKYKFPEFIPSIEDFHNRKTIFAKNFCDVYYDFETEYSFYSLKTLNFINSFKLEDDEDFEFKCKKLKKIKNLKTLYQYANAIYLVNRIKNFGEMYATGAYIKKIILSYKWKAKRQNELNEVFKRLEPKIVNPSFKDFKAVFSNQNIEEINPIKVKFLASEIIYFIVQLMNCGLIEKESNLSYERLKKCFLQPTGEEYRTDNFSTLKNLIFKKDIEENTFTTLSQIKRKEIDFIISPA